MLVIISIIFILALLMLASSIASGDVVKIMQAVSAALFMGGLAFVQYRYKRGAGKETGSEANLKEASSETTLTVEGCVLEKDGRVIPYDSVTFDAVNQRLAFTSAAGGADIKLADVKTIKIPALTSGKPLVRLIMADGRVTSLYFAKSLDQYKVLKRAGAPIRQSLLGPLAGGRDTAQYLAAHGGTLQYDPVLYVETWLAKNHITAYKASADRNTRALIWFILLLFVGFPIAYSVLVFVLNTLFGKR